MIAYVDGAIIRKIVALRLRALRQSVAQLFALVTRGRAFDQSDANDLSAIKAHVAFLLQCSTCGSGQCIHFATGRCFMGVRDVIHASRHPSALFLRPGHAVAASAALRAFGGTHRLDVAAGVPTRFVAAFRQDAGVGGGL